MKKILNTFLVKDYFKRITNCIKKENRLSFLKSINLNFINSVGIKIMLQITLLLIVVCGVLGAVSYINSYKALEDTISSSLQSRAMEASKLINSTLEQDIKAMNEIAARPEIQSMETQTQMPVLISQGKSLGYESLNIVELNGIIHLPSGAKSQIDLSSETEDVKYLRKALLGIPSISDPITNVDGQQIIAIAVPIKDKDDEVIGVLLSNMSMAKLNEIVQRTKVGNDGFCFIIRKDGTKVAHKDLKLVLNKDNTFKNVEKDSSIKPLADLESKMVKGEVGSGYYTQSNIEMFMSYAPVPNMNWYLALTIPKSEIFSAANSLKYEAAVITIIFILVGMVVAFAISKSIKNPLLEIKKYAQRLSECNLSHRIEIKRKDEFGQTAAALNSAIDSVEKIIYYVKEESKNTLSSTNDINNMLIDVHKRVQSVSETSEEISSSMQESSATIQEVTSQSMIVREEINNTVEEANQGLELANKIKDKAALIKEETEESRLRIKEAYSMSRSKVNKALQDAKVVKKISIIAENIRDIAKKTKILSLNATIEAAKAGEQGRGFSVVAKEVRNLAEQSALAVTDIQNNIKGVFAAVGELADSAEFILKVMENEVIKDYEKVIKISEDYKGDGEIFQQVIQRFSELSTKIYMSVEDISENMRTLSSSVSSCTEASIDISGNIGEISEENERITGKSAENAEGADTLIMLVSEFKIREQDTEYLEGNCATEQLATE
ncbi:methyl-accepting chemotaxis protein [Clostridium magnum]|uniref:Methyl-accepting chemotaxis protein McpB n=1 Tax=Clostridium magnum DSM 2767 TaxID=1121326 RepID=A0A162S5B6_9CLOT|nr:methyl-accepting chemotaxis protein [Clostridium magnum]KZL90791.1 methyl-accepting chemotaxis protein McpB [Clostridium magnum DSM 2767]SHI11526.1 methyl-accepting chemotaxis sensory transducer with Cache sensor [Clostridium magnum DSM 2767]